MNALLAIPLPLRLATLFVLGAIVGAVANWAIDRLRWEPRWLSPWGSRHPDLPPLRPGDRLPIWGWFGLRRETPLRGAGFWLRPFTVELLTGALFAALYWWEVERQGLYRPPLAALVPLNPQLAAQLHWQLGAHLLLVAFMLVASLIDIDEKIIPDAVTIPGTLAGLLLATCVPACLLPDVVPLHGGGFDLHEFLKVSSPRIWPAMLAPYPNLVSLGIGLACIWLWCVGLLPRPWRTRHGLGRAMQILLARIAREPFSRVVLGLAIAVTIGVTAGWFVGGKHWEGLLSALVGLAVGGGMVWCVRVIGTRVLGREAMGFGDVTLLAMIGTLVGWQSCLVIFFLAPFFGLLVGVLQWLLRRENEIYYGPFLCLATLALIVWWGSIWDWALPLFEIGGLVPMVVLICLALMVVLLAIWRWILGQFSGR
ncbi:MAG: prepilin peptidase [Pirellulales bacterium]|nr:prepilin peptidase [Pirellulales bacterium]